MGLSVTGMVSLLFILLYWCLVIYTHTQMSHSSGAIVIPKPIHFNMKKSRDSKPRPAHDYIERFLSTVDFVSQQQGEMRERDPSALVESTRLEFLGTGDYERVLAVELYRPIICRLACGVFRLEDHPKAMFVCKQVAFNAFVLFENKDMKALPFDTKATGIMKIWIDLEHDLESPLYSEFIPRDSWEMDHYIGFDLQITKTMESPQVYVSAADMTLPSDVAENDARIIEKRDRRARREASKNLKQ